MTSPPHTDHMGIRRSSSSVHPALRIDSPPRSCTSSSRCRNRTSRKESRHARSSAGEYVDGSSVYFASRSEYWSRPVGGVRSVLSAGRVPYGRLPSAHLYVSPCAI